MKRERGIALITVFLVAGLMLILLGGFLRVNQRNFDLLNNDLQSSAANQAARSAYDYCMFRLERNRYWGSQTFGGDGALAEAGFRELKEVPGTTTVKGKIDGADAAFEIQILNNLTGTGTLDGVEDGHCRLRITATSGTAKVNREAILSIAPLFDGSVIASKGIDIEADGLTLSSKDPLRNRIRSKKEISVPDYHGHFAFQPAPDASEKGVLWARDGISMGGKDLANQTYARQAQQATNGGQFLPTASTYYDVYDLQLSEVKTNESVATIKSGIYVFGTREVAYQSSDPEFDNGLSLTVIPVLERRDWTVDEAGNLAQGDVQEVWYVGQTLPDDATDWSVGLWGDLPESGIHLQDKGDFMLDEGVAVSFNALDPNTPNNLPPAIHIDGRKNLEIHGDFGVASAPGTNYRPSVIFKDFATGAVGTDGSGELVSASITTRASQGRPGSIYIEGHIAGNGKLLAEGDVTIRNTYAAVESDEESGLSIFAGGSVKIQPQRAKQLDQEEILKGNDGVTHFRGLVFARKHVLIEGLKAVDGNFLDKANVYIEGAVVAREGKVRVQHAKHVNFVYNPSFLDTILRPAKGARVRLERVVWKET